MATTRQISKQDWQGYFDRFSREFARESVRENSTLWVFMEELGAQAANETVRLEGIAFDPKDDVLEISLEHDDHLISHPTEIWSVEDENGFITALSVIREDGMREILQIQRGDSDSLEL
jgi:hypothetical protein